MATAGAKATMAKDVAYMVFVRKSPSATADTRCCAAFHLALIVWCCAVASVWETRWTIPSCGGLVGSLFLCQSACGGGRR